MRYICLLRKNIIPKDTVPFTPGGYTDLQGSNKSLLRRVAALQLSDADTPTVVVKSEGVSFDGDWNYKFVSTSGATFTGTVSLKINDTSVIGTMVVSDGSKGALVGTLINNVLSLTRDTGLETVQVFQLNGVDSNHFSGTYLNHGKSADSGTVEFFR